MSCILSILYCCTLGIINHSLSLSHRSLIFCTSGSSDLEELCSFAVSYVHISEATECNVIVYLCLFSEKLYVNKSLFCSGGTTM